MADVKKVLVVFLEDQTNPIISLPNPNPEQDPNFLQF